MQKTNNLKQTASIITPVARREAAYLRAAANSVRQLANLLPDWQIEWLLALDGPEESWVKHILRDYEGLYASVSSDGAQTGRGAAYPRNRALRSASSYWTLALDEDDAYVAKNMAELLLLVSACDAVWGAGLMYDIDDKGRIINKGPSIELGGVIPKQGIKSFVEKYGYYPFNCCATVVKTSVIKEVGGWTEGAGLLKCEDMPMWLAINSHYEGRWLNKPVHMYRRNSHSVTHQKQWGAEINDLNKLTDYAAEVSRRTVLPD